MSDITLIRANGEYWRIVKEQDPCPESPRTLYEGHAGHMLCWPETSGYGDKHHFRAPETFLSDLLLKLTSGAPHFGKPVYDFIAEGKAKDIRLETEGKKCWISYGYEKLKQTEASVQRTHAALKDLTAMLDVEMEKYDHPASMPLTVIFDLAGKFGFSVSSVIKEVQFLHESRFTNALARKDFAEWLNADLRRRYAEYETVKEWETYPDSIAESEDGKYPYWFLEKCLEELTIGEKMQILTGDALANEVVILPLYMYEHSGVSMSTSHTYPYNDQWDSRQCGWIYATREDYANVRGADPGPDWRDACTKELVSEVEEYNTYLTGDVYQVSIEKFVCPVENATAEEIAQMAKDNLEDGLYYHMEDSLGCCYGDDGAAEGIADLTDGAIGGEYEEIAV